MPGQQNITDKKVCFKCFDYVLCLKYPSSKMHLNISSFIWSI